MKVIKRWLKTYRKHLLESRIQALKDEHVHGKRIIAKLFNDMYTYSNRYFTHPIHVEGGSLIHSQIPPNYNAWMCPTCNEIHRPFASNGLTGLQYPKCCTHFAGHRLDFNISTDHGVNDKIIRLERENKDV